MVQKQQDKLLSQYRKGFIMENTAVAKPGLNVNIIFTLDIEKETADVRGAIIYDINGKDVTLSQTNPPVMEKHIGKDISVTYLIKGKNDASRYGFKGKVVNIIKDYNVSSSKTVSAILVERDTGSITYDLRMHYRVKPKSNDASIAIYLGNEKVTLMDISIGGVRFCHKKDCPVEPGNIIKVFLFIDGHRFPLDTRVVSSWLPSNAGRQPDLEHVRLQFLNMDKKCSRLLNGKILAIQREILSKQ